MSACPTSTCVGVYVFSVAPAITVHDVPVSLERHHLKLNEVGPFDQQPLFAVTAFPTTNEPSNVGAHVLAGAPARAAPNVVAAKIAASTPTTATT
jgi:hypothetical protein